MRNSEMGYFVALSKLVLTVEIYFPFTDVFQLSLQRRLMRNIYVQIIFKDQ